MVGRFGGVLLFLERVLARESQTGVHFGAMASGSYDSGKRSPGLMRYPGEADSHGL